MGTKFIGKKFTELRDIGYTFRGSDPNLYGCKVQPYGWLSPDRSTLVIQGPSSQTREIRAFGKFPNAPAHERNVALLIATGLAVET